MTCPSCGATVPTTSTTADGAVGTAYANPGSAATTTCPSCGAALPGYPRAQAATPWGRLPRASATHAQPHHPPKPKHRPE